jgi:putative phosphoesterase
MQVGVISDTHDNIVNLEKALPLLRTCSVIIHCGDLISPFMVKHIAEGVPETDVHIVWGNNEGDTHLIGEVAAKYAGIHLHGPIAQLDLEGFRVAVNHYPEIARGLAHSGLYDMVCYGHDHLKNIETIGECLLLNPGEVHGMKGISSIALLDTTTKEVEFIEV